VAGRCSVAIALLYLHWLHLVDFEIAVVAG